MALGLYLLLNLHKRGAGIAGNAPHEVGCWSHAPSTSSMTPPSSLSIHPNRPSSIVASSSIAGGASSMPPSSSSSSFPPDGAMGLSPDARPKTIALPRRSLSSSSLILRPSPRSRALRPNPDLGHSGGTCPRRSRRSPHRARMPPPTRCRRRRRCRHHRPRRCPCHQEGDDNDVAQRWR